MNTQKINTNNKKIIPLHTEQTFYHWISVGINRLKKQGNTSRLLIIGLIIWNTILSITYFKPITNIPQFTDKQNQEIMIEEYIPPFDLQPIDVKN